MSIGLYGVFLGIQTTRHRDYFVFESSASEIKNDDVDSEHANRIRSTKYHGVLLLAYVLPIVLLAKQIAVPINYGINVLGAPAAIGGLLVAILILSPECMAAVRAARANKLQRSINLSLGTPFQALVSQFQQS
jgi:Ca2+:H+ antiporter